MGIVAAGRGRGPLLTGLTTRTRTTIGTDTPIQQPMQQPGEPPLVLQISSMVPPAHFGGAERVISWLSDELVAAGVRVHDAGLAPRSSGDPEQAIRNLYWPFGGRERPVVARIPWHAIDIFTLAAGRQVEGLIHRYRPAAIVTHQLRGWGYAPWVVAARHGIPLVHVVHDFGLICSNAALWQGANCQTLCRTCRWRRDTSRRRWPGGTLVGVSRAVLDGHVAHGLPFAAAASVWHPTAAASPVPALEVPAVDPAQVPERLGFLGRLTEAKGLSLLLGAVRGGSQRLVVAGRADSVYARDLRATSGPEVDWLDWADPVDLLRDIDVLVVPSLWQEPFGLVVVEAARAGVPVLIADQPGIVEAAQAAGARHLSFAAGDESALRAALARPLGDYRVQPPGETETDLVRVILDAARAGS